MSTTYEKHIAHALELARQARGGVSPRPPVGAVIVKDGQVVGEGMTEPRPGVHAEVAAIRDAGPAARGSTMYCTLEPHAHQGVAPPCTEEIIAAGVERVVCPIEDPNPDVNGNGFRRLRAAGVEVITDVEDAQREEAEELISGFKMLMSSGRPQFTLKYAMSIDGRIATSTGESQWITGPEARQAAHELRRRSDAVVTGIGTVLADNPRLTARNIDGSATGRPRLRVVLDSHGRMPPESALLKEFGGVLWVTGEGSEREPPADNVEVLTLPTADGRVDISTLAKRLGDLECCDVLIEAGGQLAGAFVSAGLVDRVAAFIGPVVIGGEAAPGPVEGEGIQQIANALRLEEVKHEAVGDSVLVTGRVARPQANS